MNVNKTGQNDKTDEKVARVDGQPGRLRCYVYDINEAAWDAEPVLEKMAAEVRVVVQGQYLGTVTYSTPLPLFSTRPELVDGQTLAVRHVRMEANEVFGGGGADHGAVISLAESTCRMEYVDVIGNTQKGVGAIVFAVQSTVDIFFARFEENRNLGLGAGVIAASGSRVSISNSRFTGSFVKNQMGLTAARTTFELGLVGIPPIIHRASCITADRSDISASHSFFGDNVGGDVIAASDSSVDLVQVIFYRNKGGGEDSAPTQGRQRYWEDGPSATVSLWEGSDAKLQRVSFIDNIGASAGAVFVTQSQVNFDQVKFVSNRGLALDMAAGAILARKGAVIHGTNCTFSNNFATSKVAAGAIHLSNGAVVALTDTMLVDNTAAGSSDSNPGMDVFQRSPGSTESIFGAGALYAEDSAVSLVQTMIKQCTTACGNCAANTYNVNQAADRWDNGNQFECVFGATETTRSNYAEALYVARPAKIFIRDSIIEPLQWGDKTIVIHPRIVNPGEVTQGSCQQHPCAQGHSCTYAKYSTSCQSCPKGTHSSDGVSCQLCPPGTGPSADQTRCEPCGGPDRPRIYSEFGVCLECLGENVVSHNHTKCDLPCYHTIILKQK
jgi:hypothetical protein